MISLTEFPETIHGTAISYAGKAAVIIGPSGCGKSGLALQLMALGAGLLADDRVVLTSSGDLLMASCPPTISGLIEARGVGVLNAKPAPPAPVAVVVDLAQTETDRVPHHRNVTRMGHVLPLLWGVDAPHFPATLLQFLSHGRSSR